MSATNTFLVYITCKDESEAKTIATTLVEEKLIACANIYNPVTSIFSWEGKIQEETETLLMAKTRDHLKDEVTARTKELHSYTCPCVVMLPINDGNPEFLRWVSNETK